MTNIFIENYTNDNPINKIKITSKNEKDLDAYLDTGCTLGIVLTKNDVKKLGIKLGPAINSHPERILIADGTYVGSYLYDVKISFKGEIHSTILTVLHPNLKIKLSKAEKDELEHEPVEGLMGREIMDDYSVTFNGLSNPKSFKFDN